MPRKVGVIPAVPRRGRCRIRRDGVVWAPFRRGGHERRVVMGFSIGHLLIVLLIVLLLFGAKKLRSIGADLGGAVKGFRDSMGDGNKDAEAAAAKERIENQAARNTIDATATVKEQSKDKV